MNAEVLSPLAGDDAPDRIIGMVNERGDDEAVLVTEVFGDLSGDVCVDPIGDDPPNMKNLFSISVYDISATLAEGDSEVGNATLPSFLFSTSGGEEEEGGVTVLTTGESAGEGIPLYD